MRSALPALLFVAACTACGNDDPWEGVPAYPTDAGSHDADPDSDTSSPLDATIDAADDAANDAKEDALPDAMVDAGSWAPFGLLSLNLHCLKLDGTSFSSNEQRFAAIASAVQAENVAAIALQEVCTNNAYAAMTMMQSALEDATGETWTFAFAPAHVAWQGTPDEADEGVAVLARGTLADEQLLTYRSQSALSRVAVAATLPPALGGLRWVAVHLDYADAAVRVAQARETASTFVAASDPSLDILVAGDFNATPGSPPLQAMGAFGFVELTGSLGPGRIDHVLAHRGAAVALTEARVLFDGTTYPVVSDHPGMLVRIAPASPPAIAVTRLRAQVDVGVDHHLAVRGDTAPLSWSEGWPAASMSPSEWKLVLTEIPSGATFAYKFLRDDVDWQVGDDAVGMGGQDHTIAPGF